MEKDRNGILDILRVLCSMFIIMIHTNNNNKLLFFCANTVGRLAVPIFMIITGYYYFRNPSSKKKKVTIKKLLWLWFVWQVVYIPRGILAVRNDSSLDILAKFLKGFVGSSIFYSGSWYLIATVFGLIIVDKLRLKKHYYVMTSISLFILLFDLFSTNYMYVMPIGNSMSHIIEVVNPHSTIITGVLWMSLSLFIANNINSLKKICNVVTLMTSFLLLVLEYCFVHYNNFYSINNDMYFTLPIVVVVLFVLLQKHTYTMAYSHSIYLRNLSSLVFFAHFGVISLSKFINFQKFSLALFIFVVILSFLVSMVTIKLSRFQRFKFIEYIY
ncbi:acyltransferase family protein [Lactiplantibacillus plantarum]|uniref:acyltransferase family protein n=1 Tax=Lactiplantibacillus plantarum TaxID=1590 RepID=UPI0006CB0CB6|nr:acyltransferase family protein [Lactiplantibacillus plantarum]ALF13834.1 hypothetical protein AKJ11_01405 [Lactiplantibacillus plantarum]MDX3787413.1 hypothetical protein [Lactiplantibacillus plantarum]MDX3813050.1 hypothetical protein [Lactiplantibacillus plantarum]MDX3858540.1 hypothetical protein [Lactiplantibacillus plantarum]WOI05209.1 hypothetical protein RI097_04865 [Lactiplantibacillus plantarum]